MRRSVASGISDSIRFIASSAMSRPWNLRKLPTHPITNRPSNPSRCLTSSPRRSGENISGSTPLGVTSRRSSGTPSRPTCSAISMEPQATTSAALSKGASAVRSRMPCQPGRFTPQPAASWTMRAGVKTTKGRSRALAAVTPASWNRSWRCHTNRTSSDRQGPSSPATRNWRASRAFRASLRPVLIVVGTRRRNDAGPAGPFRATGSDALRMISSGSRTPSGVTIHDRPQSLLAAAAQLATLIHEATGAV